MKPKLLAAHLELRSCFPPAGSVLLVNQGRSKVRVWRMGNTWGDNALVFEMTSQGRRQRITRNPQIYTRNVPSSVPITPGEKCEIPFDLGDGSWQPAVVTKELDAQHMQLAALYEVTSSPEALACMVWIGHVRTEAVPLG